MAGNARQVINMANSIVGVSILSMPFCFKETGLLLGILLVLCTGFITKKTCMFLIRSAIMARRRSYEFLAFHVFGVSGKLFVEMCMILFLIGICISFHVVVGDLAPAIVARFMNVENSPSLRCTLLVGIAILVILPLCLLRNLDNLASMSACSIMFYVFLIAVIFWHAFPKLWDGSWIHTAELWRPAGALQVLPILSLALACQSNVFEIYDSVPDPDVPKMRFVVNHAVNLCSALYISVGFLGYVAFVDRDFSGNIIMSFPNSELTEGIKVFFTVSLAISFPLMIFPCRTSIHSLLYRRNNPSSFDLVGNYMPEARFKAITFGILISSLIIGILIPNIEFVLGLLGSTMGMLIALILPSLLFIKVNTKASAERLLAQGIMLMGLMLIVTGTYLNVAHIYAVQTEVRAAPTDMARTIQEPQLPNIEVKVPEGVKKDQVSAAAEDTATRKEPVAPEPPPEEEKVNLKEKIKKEDKDSEKKEGKIEEKDVKKEEGSVINPEKTEKKLERESVVKKEAATNAKNADTLHPDAIKKEEKVNEEEIDKEQEDKEIEKKQVEILEKMEVQHQEQQQILEEQKKILKELKDQKQKQEDDAKKQEDDAKRQEEIKVVAPPADGQQAAGIEPAAVANPLLSRGGESLVGVPMKSQLSPDNLAAMKQGVPAAVEPAAYQGENNALPVDNQPDNQPQNKMDGGLPAVPVVNQPAQNLLPPNQPVSVPVPAVDSKRVAHDKANHPALDQSLKISPPLPMVYYHSVPNPPSAALLSPNQQMPVVNPAGLVGPAADLAGQPALAVPVGQGVAGGHVAAQPVAAGSYVAQPVAAGSYVAQPVPPMSNNAGQPVLAPNYVAPAGQANYYAAQPVPAGNYAGQVNYAAQPAALVNAAAQPFPAGAYAGQANYAAQPGPVLNVAAQAGLASNVAGQPGPALNVAGQPAPVLHAPAHPVLASNIIGEPAHVMNFAGQPIQGANIAGQPIQEANIAAQPVAPANYGGQSAFAANIVAPPAPLANGAGYPAPVGNRPTPASNLVPRAVSPGSIPSQFNNDVKPKIDTPELPPSNKKASIKFEDDSNLKERLIKESVSQKIAEKILKPLGEKNDKVLLKPMSSGSKARGKASQNEILTKTKKKTRHDEERRKRQADKENLLDLPPVEIMNELKWKEFGDVAYDTRHLLWTGRSSRRKKRNKGRDEDYYWDET